jgi:hypothetical protein
LRLRLGNLQQDGQGLHYDAVGFLPAAEDPSLLT